MSDRGRYPLKQRPFPQRQRTKPRGPNKAQPNKSRLSKCLARSDSPVQTKSDSPLDSDSRVQTKSDSPLDSDSGLWGPKQNGLHLGRGLPGPKHIGHPLRLGHPGPKQIGLLLGLGLPGPRPDRTPKSAPLKTDSYLDSDSVRSLGPGGVMMPKK
jgi:hypothetical protein